ncbi:putative mitochondrial protein [Trifolium repens]|nr:putative mitochondrial protein [Trifolium repens]
MKTSIKNIEGCCLALKVQETQERVDFLLFCSIILVLVLFLCFLSRFLAALYTVPPFGGVRRKYIWLGKRFDKYAILGDDICIADSKVAEVYLSTLKDLGVTISLPKSLVSDVGGAEFAKKFRLLGKLNHTKSSTVLRLKAIWLKAKLPFELWLGQCCPVDPYLKKWSIDLEASTSFQT